MAKKKPEVVTPAGVLKYPHANKPDGRFANGDETKAKYKTGIEFKLDAPGVTEMKDKIDEFAKANKVSKVPYTVDEAEGTLLLKAQSGHKYRPRCQDSQGQPIDLDTVEIWGGTTARIKVQLDAYEGFGGGVTAYWSATRVLELVTGGGGDDFGDPEDGFAAGDEPAAVVNDDDCPF